MSVVREAREASSALAVRFVLRSYAHLSLLLNQAVDELAADASRSIDRE